MTDVGPPGSSGPHRPTGRLSSGLHTGIPHHPWTPLGVVLALIAIAVMVVILIIFLNFALSVGAH